MSEDLGSIFDVLGQTPASEPAPVSGAAPAFEPGSGAQQSDLMTFLRARLTEMERRLQDAQQKALTATIQMRERESAQRGAQSEAEGVLKSAEVSRRTREADELLRRELARSHERIRELEGKLLERPEAADRFEELKRRFDDSARASLARLEEMEKVLRDQRAGAQSLLSTLAPTEGLLRKLTERVAGLEREALKGQSVETNRREKAVDGIDSRIGDVEKSLKNLAELVGGIEKWKTEFSKDWEWRRDLQKWEQWMRGLADKLERQSGASRPPEGILPSSQSGEEAALSELKAELKPEPESKPKSGRGAAGFWSDVQELRRRLRTLEDNPPATR